MREMKRASRRGTRDNVQTGVQRALRTPGKPLEPSSRASMEQRFGHDFSKVRVHAGQQAAASAESMRAAAYAVGEDIVFAEGAYAPDTVEGRLLLAHELTHVVQQDGRREPLGEVGSVDRWQTAGAEQEAAELAPRVVQGEGVDVSVSAPASLACAEESWWDKAMSAVGMGANALSAGAGGARTLGTVAAASKLGAPGLLTNLIGAIPGVGRTASLGQVGIQSAEGLMDLSTMGKGLGMASNVASGLGMGVGAYNFLTATNRSDQVQAAADTTASGIGLLGPVGTAFSAGYSGGQLLDQALGISDAASDWAMEEIGPGPGLWLADKLGL